MRSAARSRVRHIGARDCNVTAANSGLDCPSMPSSWEGMSPHVMATEVAMAMSLALLGRAIRTGSVSRATAVDQLWSIASEKRCWSARDHYTSFAFRPFEVPFIPEISPHDTRVLESCRLRYNSTLVRCAVTVLNLSIPMVVETVVSCVYSANAMGKIA